MNTDGGRSSGTGHAKVPVTAAPNSRPVIDVEGGAGVFIGTDRASGDIIAVVYEQAKAGWWRGIIRGNRVREMYLPMISDDPLKVVERFLS